LRDFADSFIDVDNFVSAETIVSASSVMTLALIWIGYPQNWVYSEFKVVYEGYWDAVDFVKVFIKTGVDDAFVEDDEKCDCDDVQY